MRTKTIGVTAAVTLLAVVWARGQEPTPKAAEAEKVPGPRLRVQFVETRQRGEAKVASRTYAVMVHADAGGARVFTGTQVALIASGPAAPATTFKNAGVEVQVSAHTAANGRYRLDAKFEEGSVPDVAAGGPVTGDNPILQVVRGESSVTLRPGETVPLASVIDPMTGDQVTIDVSAAATPGPPAAATGEPTRLRARFVLVRRQGEKTIARRPYTVTLEPEGEAAASVFGGSMLPVQLMFQGQPTVMLKDVGAGLQLKARRLADGRFRLEVSFSDGILAPGPRAPKLRVFQSESEVLARVGETLAIASAADPETGETVDVELTLEGIR